MYAFFTPRRSRSHGGSGISGCGDGQRPLESDRLPRIRAVVQGLADGDPEGENEDCEPEGKAPAQELPAAAALPAPLPLDRPECRHGA